MHQCSHTDRAFQDTWPVYLHTHIRLYTYIHTYIDPYSFIHIHFAQQRSPSNVPIHKYKRTHLHAWLIPRFTHTRLNVLDLYTHIHAHTTGERKRDVDDLFHVSCIQWDRQKRYIYKHSYEKRPIKNLASQRTHRYIYVYIRMYSYTHRNFPFTHTYLSLFDILGLYTNIHTYTYIHALIPTYTSHLYTHRNLLKIIGLLCRTSFIGLFCRRDL